MLTFTWIEPKEYYRKYYPMREAFFENCNSSVDTLGEIFKLLSHKESHCSQSVGNNNNQHWTFEGLPSLMFTIQRLKIDLKNDNRKEMINIHGKYITSACSAWFGHIHMPLGTVVRGGFIQSMWNASGQKSQWTSWPTKSLLQNNETWFTTQILSTFFEISYSTMWKSWKLH